MKIKDMIAKLQRIEQDHGNVEVCFDSSGTWVEVQNVEVDKDTEDSKIKWVNIS